MTPPELIPGGVPLSSVPGLNAEQLAVLAGLWITTAQEVVALAQHQASHGLLAAALSLDRSGLDRLFELAQRKIPPTRAAHTRRLELASLALDFGSGARLDEPEPELARRRGLPLYRPAAGRALLPDSLTLLDQLPPARNQGSRGTCVAHAVTALREHLEIAAGCLPDLDLSEQYLYWWCKQHDGAPSLPGTYLATATRCLEECGLPPEEAWPYQGQQGPREDGGTPPAAVLDGDPAYRTRCTVEFNPADIGGMKNRLAEGRLIALTVPMYPSWFQSPASRRWGKITLPLPGENPDGGHALALAGFQDEPRTPGGGYFVARNAWGGWGYDSVWSPGYACIPYAYVARLATDVRSAERVAQSPLFVRDEADGQERSQGQPTWSSPDLWLRRAADQGQDMQTPAPGKENFFYVRAFNRGPAYAYRVQAQLFAAPLSPAVPGSAWTSLGFCAAERLSPGEGRVMGPLAWQPTATEAGAQHAYQVRLDCTADPLGKNLELSTNDNVAEQHLWILEMAPSTETELFFPVMALNAAARTPSLQVERLDLPPDVVIGPIAWASSEASSRRGRSLAGRSIPPQRGAGGKKSSRRHDGRGADRSVSGFLSGLMDALPWAQSERPAQRLASLSVTLPAGTIPGTRYSFAVVQWEIPALLGREVRLPVQYQVTGRMTVRIRVVRG